VTNSLSTRDGEYYTVSMKVQHSKDTPVHVTSHKLTHGEI